MTSIPRVLHSMSALAEGFARPGIARSRRRAERVVVVGNGMASHRFCERLTELDPGGRFEVRVAGEEPHPAYDRVHLADYVRHGDAGRLLLASRDWYESRGIELITGDPATRIDRERRAATTASGRELMYDRLVLATGSAPLRPPIDGIAAPGVFFYRTIGDLDGILKAARGSRKALVVGGGLLGLEAARALRDLDLEVEVVEIAALLMPRQLDIRAAAALRRRIEEQGIGVRLSARVDSIGPCGGRLRVVLDGIEVLLADMVVISAGIRPRDELARECGLEVAVGGGVLVDDRMRSSDPRVWAIGECASVAGTVFGLAGPGLRMAETAAETIAGRRARFRDADMSVRLKMLGVEVASLGESLAEGEYHVHETGDSYRRVVVRGGRLVGCTSVGAWEETARLRDRVAARGRISRGALRRFVETGRLLPEAEDGVAAWPEAATVCSCRSVARGTLSRAIASGCATPASIAKTTGAGTVCGSCAPLVAELLGSPPVAASRPRRALLGLSALAVAFAIVHAVAPPPPIAESVASPDYAWQAYRRSDVFRQCTGWGLAALALGATMFSLRKRVRRIRFGDFDRWRTVHGAIGVATLVGLYAHTGFRLGTNLNLALALCLVAANATGGATGALVGLEPVRGWARRAKPFLTLVHILVLWPLPPLLALHVFAAYYF